MDEILLLDEQFKSIYIIDSYESFIWTERYYGYGDFEIYTLPTPELLNVVKQDYYIWIKDSRKVMIIESIQISTEVETGDRLIISGRSLESILDRRIIWEQTTLDGNLQTGIQKLLNENAINPDDYQRQLGDLYFKSSDDPKITNLTIRAQYTGDNLYDAIEAICRSNNIGFSIELDENNRFVFSLYSGEDRSYNQFSNPWVVFSSQNENLISSKYIESKKTLKNVALVLGEERYKYRIISSAHYTITQVDQWRERETVYDWCDGNPSKFKRREVYIDARDLQSEKSDGTTMDNVEYHDLMSQRGREKLTEHKPAISFEGKLETKFGGYTYGKNLDPNISGNNFYLGDIVQVVNEYGIERMARVEEMVRSLNISGYEVYPTFSIVEEV